MVEDRTHEDSLTTGLLEDHSPALLARSTNANRPDHSVCCTDRADLMIQPNDLLLFNGEAWAAPS